jgi:DNA (cytosine-5)-methyltransferase 1
MYPTIVETFVGCGGAHLGFKNNGFNTLLVNDIDPNMIKTLILNNAIEKEQSVVCSISELTDDLLDEKIKETVDVLFGGIVCKGFSLAGVRNPFDERNYLYKEQLRLVKKLKPKVSVIENVVGLKNMYLYEKNINTNEVFKKYSKLSDENKNLNGEKSSRRKENINYDDLQEKIKINKKKMEELLNGIQKYKYKVFDDIKSIYEKLGYTVYDSVLQANKFNGYTHRKRIIIVAVRNDIKKKFNFPKEEKSYTLNDALKKIDIDGINNPNIDVDNKPMNHTEKSIKRFKYIPEGKNIADVINKLPDDLKISKFYSRGNTQRLDRNLSVPTLVPGHSNFPIHPWEHRSITVREAATITGFPLDYKFYGSHTSRCMQIGNAVPVYLGDAIAKSVLEVLK